MAHHDIIVIGASAGGVEALTELLPLLPAGLRAAVFVLLHRAAETGRHDPDPLPRVLARRSKLPVVRATDGERIEHGRLYVAPPGCHLLLEPERVRVDPSAPPHPSRFGVNTLFRSAALAHGERVVAVLLSGALDDGTAGLWEVRSHGGVTIIQDPAHARLTSMPAHALGNVPVHHCLPVPEIAARLVQLAAEAPEVAARRGARVLIVEDERIAAEGLAHRLESLGYDVIGAVATGEEAVELALRTAPDVVLMDIQLAGRMRGTDAARALRERSRIPVVFLTAYSDDSTLADACAADPAGIVVKPCRPPQIHSAIQLALERSRRELPLDAALAPARAG